MFYAKLLAKLVVGFLCLLAYLNLSGRAQLASNSAADQIGNYVLGGIIGGVIYNTSISILEMVLVMFIWGLFMFAMRVFKARNRQAKKFIDGHSLKIIDHGALLTDNLRLAGKTVRDFVADMHIRGIKNLDDLQTVWLEINGQYTLLRKDENPFPIAYIEDGQAVTESLILSGHDTTWLEAEVKKQGFDSVSSIAFAEWGQDGLRIYPYE